MANVTEELKFFNLNLNSGTALDNMPLNFHGPESQKQWHFGWPGGTRTRVHKLTESST